MHFSLAVVDSHAILPRSKRATEDWIICHALIATRCLQVGDDGTDTDDIENLGGCINGDAVVPVVRSDCQLVMPGKQFEEFQGVRWRTGTKADAIIAGLATHRCFSAPRSSRLIETFTI